MAEGKSKYQPNELDDFIDYFENKDQNPVRAHLLRLARADLVVRDKWTDSKTQIRISLTLEGIPFQVEKLDDEINLINKYIKVCCTTYALPDAKKPAFDEADDSDIVAPAIAGFFARDEAPGVSQEDARFGDKATDEETIAALGEEGFQFLKQFQDETIAEAEAGREAGFQGTVQATDEASKPKSNQVVVMSKEMNAYKELKKNPNSLPRILKFNDPIAVADRTQAYLRCRFLLDNKPYGGQMNVKGCSLNTTFRIENPIRDPKAVIRIQASGRDSEAERIALVEFDLGCELARGMQPSASFKYMKTFQAANPRDAEQKAYHAIYWVKYSKVTVSGVGNLKDTNVPKEFHSVFNALEELVHPEPGHHAILPFELTAFGDKGYEVLEKIHDSMFATYPLNYGPYLTEKGMRFNARLGRLATRKMTFEASGGGIPPYPARNAFRSSDGALIAHQRTVVLEVLLFCRQACVIFAKACSSSSIR